MFNGNVYKHKGMVHFEGLLTITTAVTSFNTVIASLYNRGISVGTFLLIGYVDNSPAPIYFYPSGYNVLSRSNLSVGMKVYINSVVPL